MPMEPGAVRIEELLAHANWVQELASRLVRDPAAADDVTQDVWARALRSPPRERTNLRGWLAATVRTSARALRRGQSRRSEHEERAFIEREEPSAAELVERAQLHRQLVEQVLALSEPHRAIVLAHWFEGRSIVAIAERHGLTPRIAKARLDEAHEELRRKLDASHGGRAAWLSAFTAWTQSPTAVATGSGFVIGGLAMGTKLKASIACAAALLLWLGLRDRDHAPQPDPTPAPAAAAAEPKLEPGMPDGRGAISASAPTSALDAVLDVEVTDAFTHEAIPDVTLVPGFDPEQREKLPKFTASDIEQLRSRSRSDAHGRANIAVPSGVPMSMHSWREDTGIAGVVQELAPLVSGEHRKVRVELQFAPDVHLFVRVLAREDRHPIRGAVATVALRPPLQFGSLKDRPGQPESVQEDAATSDDQGRLDFWLGSWRLMHLRVTAPGFACAYAFGDARTEADEPLELLLDRGATVPLHVVDLGGMPVQGVQIQLSGDPSGVIQPRGTTPPDGSGWPPAIWSAMTRGDGRCTIEGLPSGMNLRPKLSKPGVNARGTPDPFTLVPGENSEIVWRFGASCALSGRALDAENKPVAGLEIWLRCQSDNPHSSGPKRTSYFFQQYSGSISESTMTDATGAYRFDRVAPGIAWVGPACRRGQGAAPIPGELAPIADEVEIPETAESVEHDLHVQPGLYVRGRVVDPQGKPVRTFLKLRAADGNNAWSDQSGGDGTFIAGPVGEGAFLVTADPPLWGSFAASEDLPVKAGDLDALVKLRQGASLEASIVDDESGDACKGRIILSLRGGDSAGRTLNLSQDPTHFSCTCVLPGIYDVMARTQDGRVGIVRGVDIQTNATADLVVRVKPAAKLRARLEGKYPWGALIVHNAEAEVVRDAVSRGGLFEAWVPPGHLVIEFTPELTEKPQRREIDIKAGEEQELVFRDEG